MMQLEPDPENLQDYFRRALVRLAPGQGAWISQADPVHLKSDYSFPDFFLDPKWTSLASKLRVCETVATDAASKDAELFELQSNISTSIWGLALSIVLFNSGSN